MVYVTNDIIDVICVMIEEIFIYLLLSIQNLISFSGINLMVRLLHVTATISIYSLYNKQTIILCKAWNKSTIPVFRITNVI